MKRPNHLNAQLKQADIELRNYVSQLEKEIDRLQKYNAKLEVQHISDQSKITALKKMPPSVIVHPIKFGHGDKDAQQTAPDETLWVSRVSLFR